MIIESLGVDLDRNITYKGYYLSIREFIISICIRDKDMMFLINLKHIRHKATMIWYLNRAITQTIKETLKENPKYAEFYKNKLKKEKRTEVFGINGETI
ncbi:hypothetical protein F7731_18060 [Cytobacillus depressus]|uniref:Uncharacterized protein n=1 Tax=Cytobacillus depressus TaxID=1602942 RepID=A0A6L3V352_9BACI|nr:hypothetical protein F7731_18060 [Cytobacillus depressus]